MIFPLVHEISQWVKVVKPNGTLCLMEYLCKTKIKDEQPINVYDQKNILPTKALIKHQTYGKLHVLWIILNYLFYFITYLYV